MVAANSRNNEDVSRLDFVESGNIDGLNLKWKNIKICYLIEQYTHVVFEAANFFFKEVSSNFIVFNDTADLKFLDTIADWDKFGSSPEETIGFDFTNFGFEGAHISFIIPWFYIQDDVWLGDENTLFGFLGGFAFIVSSNAFGLNIIIDLTVRESLDVLTLILSASASSSSSDPKRSTSPSSSSAGASLISSLTPLQRMPPRDAPRFTCGPKT